MHPTVDMLRATYILLTTTPPFRGWNMPPADEVEFHVISVKNFGGDYIKCASGFHRIRINCKWCGSVSTLIKYMAHEMVHLHVDEECPSDRAHHGKRFLKAAATVCRHHCLDPAAF